MMYTPVLISAAEILLVTIPALLSIAYVTVAERKTMASMQRRVGPNSVGYYGLLQAFADALKLLLKEYVSPTQANMILFFLGPIITLIFSLLGFAIVPYGPGLAIFDISLGIFYMLAVSSIATYGILLAGWSANSKYAFLGSLRSTAQLISYELILSSAILLVVFITSSLNLTVNIEFQKCVWFAAPLFPIFIIFFIGAVAETNRAPFDLAEAESELVSGFMTEHSSVIFVFFFLAEYGSLVLMCVVITLLFLGGYNLGFGILLSILDIPYRILASGSVYFYAGLDFFLLNIEYLIKGVEYLFTGSIDHSNYPPLVKYSYSNSSDISSYSLFNFTDIFIISNTLSSLALILKTLVIVFGFIWVRASFPRIRFDQLMTDCWTILLPIVFAFIIFIPSLMLSLDILPSNILFH